MLLDRISIAFLAGRNLLLEKFEKGENVMKRCGMIVLIVCLFVVPFLAQAQSPADKVLDRVFGREESRIRPEDLSVLKLEISPDTIRQRQRVAFQVTISNSSRHSGRVTLAIKDNDEIISEVRDTTLRPGDNEVIFPDSSYRFSRSDHCFIVEADIERTRRPIDAAKEFCARKTNWGWTLSDEKIGPSLYVEELEMNPDPATPDQEIRFKVRLRNDGRRPIRCDIRIQDRDQVVAQVENISIPRGSSEFQFSQSRYTFQRLDTCFTVLVDFERTPYPVDASREFCAKPMGWTLRP